MSAVGAGGDGNGDQVGEGGTTGIGRHLRGEWRPSAVETSWTLDPISQYPDLWRAPWLLHYAV